VKVILEAGGAVQTATTDANGRAVFSTAPTGAYELSAVPPATLSAAAVKLRDLHVGATGTDVVMILPHREPIPTPPPRSPHNPERATLTGTVYDKNGVPQPGFGSPPAHKPGNVGIVTYTGFFSTLTDSSGRYTIPRPLSDDSPASTGSLFAGNWDGSHVSDRPCLGGSRLYFTQYDFVPAVHAFKLQTTVRDLRMQAVTGSLNAELDADGQAFLRSFDTGGSCGFSLTLLFLYHATHSEALDLAYVWHDSGVANVTTPVPQIPLAQGVYWYGVGVAGPLPGGDVFGITLTFLVSGASALRVSYLPRPGNPSVGAGPSPEISWTASSGATLYRVNVYDSRGNLVFLGATSTSLSIKLPMELPSGSYSVEVVANDTLKPTDLLGGRLSGGRPLVRPMGLVLGGERLQVRADRQNLFRELDPLVAVFRPGGPLFRPLLDRTPFSNNDIRTSWSDLIPFTR